MTSRIKSIDLARRIIVCVLMIFSAVVVAASQTNPEKSTTASVTGKVTLKNKAVPGVAVLAEVQNPRVPMRANYHGTTDQSGNYRITNLPAATYRIRPIAPSFVFDDELTNDSVVVSAGENVEDVNFSLIPGGVITGKITDADNKPVIDQRVTVGPVDGTNPNVRWIPVFTDDRGIYRAFGLRAGKYKVSVGQNELLPGEGGPTYRQTFYPSVTDVEKATVIDVKEGSETTNVDIAVGRPVSTFKISGRVLDAETGKPLVNINYGVYQGRADNSGGTSIVGRNFTNANGEFKLENALPGKYVVFIVPGDSDVRGDSVSVEVVDRDVNDLVINAGKP